MPEVKDRPAVVEPLADGTAPEGYELRADGRCYRVEPATPEPSDAERGALAERERIEGIINAATAVKRRRDDPEVLRMIRDGAPLVDAQRFLLDELRRGGRDDAGPRVGPSVAVVRDPHDHILAAIRGAFLHRINPEHFKLDEHARQYRSYSVVRCAEEVLEQRGTRTRHCQQERDHRRRARARSPGRLPHDERLRDHARRRGEQVAASASTTAAPQTWLPLATLVNFPDFKPVRRLELGDGPALKQVLEHGEFTRGTIAEGKEQFALLTYGRIFALTRQALVNDDLDAFSRVPQLFARSARNLESDLVWGEILANAVMADALRSSRRRHGNLTTPGTIISISSLGVARAAMARQKGMDGATYLTLRGPVSARAARAARRSPSNITTAVTPATNAAVNPFAGLGDHLGAPARRRHHAPEWHRARGRCARVVRGREPRSNPDHRVRLPRRRGGAGARLAASASISTGSRLKARLDFAAKVMNYRGLYKNAGATLPTGFDVLGRAIFADAPSGPA